MAALWVAGVLLVALGATIITRTSQYPQATTPHTNDLILLSVAGTGGVYTAIAGATNNFIRYDDLKAAINSAVSNGTYTNLTIIQTQTFNVAKGGHLTVYSNLTILKAGPSKLLRTDSDTNVAAVTIGTGLAFDGTTLSRDALTGDVTTSGDAATIANDAVTYAKMQNVSAASRLLGRGSASGSGDAQELDVGAGLQISGTTVSAIGVGVYRDQSIEAGAMYAGPTAATTGTYTNTVNDTLSDSWTFADAATQSARFALTLPDAWNLGTIKVKLYVTCDGTNAAGITNLVWGVKAGSLAPLEALTNAVFGTQVFVTNGLDTAGHVLQLFTSPAITVGGSPAAGDSIWFEISRQGSSASDTWTNVPVRLLKARVQWLEGSTAPSSW